MRENENPFWYTAVSTIVRKFSKDIARKMTEHDYNVIRRVYEKAGGSWELLAEGDLQAWEQLRNACSGFFRVRKERGANPYGEEE